MSDYISFTNGLLIAVLAMQMRIIVDLAKVKEHIRVCPHLDVFKE